MQTTRPTALELSEQEAHGLQQQELWEGRGWTVAKGNERTGLRNLGKCLTLLTEHKSRFILLPSSELCGCKTGMSGETGSTSC